MPIKRLHWGCGKITPVDWINADIAMAPGANVLCDIRQGLPLASDSIDYISSQHALQDLKIYDQVKAMRELYRVLKNGGVLRLCLPDLDVSIEAYQSGNRNHFYIWDWDTIAGNFITHVLWYNETNTLFTYEFAEELLHKAAFKEVRRVAFHETSSPYREIVELDSRPHESFYCEAVK